MGQILAQTQRLQVRGGQTVDFQSTRDDNGVDPEYHAFISLEGLYMIVKITNPFAESVVTYHIGNNEKNKETRKSDPVEFETAWLARNTTLVFVRYDKILETFFV